MKHVYDIYLRGGQVMTVECTKFEITQINGTVRIAWSSDETCNKQLGYVRPEEVTGIVRKGVIPDAEH